jgi:hypothetical protein
MFAKQAQIAVAAIALSIAGSAFAQSVERNVFRHGNLQPHPGHAIG